MREYQPITPFTTPGTYFIPTETMVKGVLKKTFDAGHTFYCSFRTFGGTDRVVDGITTVEDTATIETWYDPSLTSKCKLLIDGDYYEILGKPEDIGKRHKWYKMKIRAITGGA